MSWNSRPAAADEPSSTLAPAPDAVEVRLDVTGSAKRLADPDAAARGWLIQVVHPLPWDGPEPGAAPRSNENSSASYPGPSPSRRPSDRRRADGKLILACVRSHPQADKTSFFEQVLLAAVLADPDVLAWSRNGSCRSASTSSPRPIRLTGRCRGPGIRRRARFFA